MADVAQLGIQVKTNGTSKAAADLTKLAGAADRAESSALGMSGAIGRINSSQISAMQSRMGGVARASEQASKAAAGQALAMQRVEAMTLDAAGAMDTYGAAAGRASAQTAKANAMTQRMGGSFAGLGAQFQDIGVTAAMGMNPMIIGLQQGTQIAGQFAFAMQNGGSAVGVLRTAVLSLITPVALMSIGLTVVIAALIQLVNWPNAAASALEFLANNLDSIVKYAGAAAAALSLMYAPSILGGIAAATTAVYGLASAAVAAAVRFVLAWAAAAGPFTLIIAAIAAVVSAVYIFRDEISQAIGIDVPSAATNAANKIVGAFVGAYAAVVGIWKNIPAALVDLLISATNGVISAIETMLNKAIELVNKFITGISNAMKSLPGMEMFGGLNTIPTVSIQLAENNFAGAARKTGINIRNAFADAMSRDYIGAGSDLATAFIGNAKDRILGLADGLRASGEEDKKKGGKSAAEKAAESYQGIVDGANRSIASNKAAMAAIGQTAEEALRLKYSQDLLNQAQQKGLTLTAAQTSELMGLAAEMARTETAVTKAKEALDFAKSATNGFFSDLRSGLANGEGFWKSFGNAANNVLDKIVDKIQNNLVDALFSIGSAGGGGGIGSIFSSILGGFANGGYTGNGATGAVAGVVHGQEYVMPADATKRIGVSNLDAMARGGGGAVAPRPSGGNSRVAVDNQVTVSVDDEGALQAFVNSRVSQSESRVSQQMAESRKGEPKRVAGYNQQRQIRRPIT